MHLFWHEVRKLLNRKEFWGMFAALLLANAILTQWQIFRADGQEEQVITQEGYAAYVDGLIRDAEKIAGLSIFADENSYANRNARKIIAVYGEIRNVQITPQPGAGLRLFSETAYFDMLMTALLLALCYWGVLEEKLCGHYTLNRTMRNGRKHLGRAKLLAIAAVFYGSFFLFYLQRFLTVFSQMDMGEAGRSVQSVFEASTVRISVLQYLLLSLAGKTGAFLLLLAVLFFLCQLCRDARNTLLLWLFLLPGSAGAYYGIADNSWLVLWRQLNLWHFLDGSDFLRQFRTIDLFGYPVSYQIVFLTAVPVLLAVFLLPDLFLYGKVPAEHTKAHRKGWPCWRGHTRLFWHEGYKLFWMGRWWMIACVLLVICALFLREKDSLYATEQEYYEWNYCEELKGEWSEEKAQYLLQEESRFDRMWEQIEQGGLAAIGASAQLGVYNGYQTVCARAAYIQNVKNGWLLYEKGYRELFMQTNPKEYGMKCAVMLSLLLLAMGTVWGMEKRYEQEKLIAATKQGIRRIRAKKHIWCIVAATLCFVLSLGPLYLRVWRVYGLFGWNAPAASLQFLERVPSGLTVGSCILLQILFQFCIVQAAAFLMLAAVRLFFRE